MKLKAYNIISKFNKRIYDQLGYLTITNSRYKHVSFEIIPTEEPGVFDVAGKFMNVQMDKVELIFQVIKFSLFFTPP